MNLTPRQKLVAALAFVAEVVCAGSAFAAPSYSIANAPSNVNPGGVFIVDVVLDLDGSTSIGHEVSVNFTPGVLIATGAVELGVPPYQLNLTPGVREIDNSAGVVDQFEAATFAAITPATPFIVGQITFQAGEVGAATLIGFFGPGAAVLDASGQPVGGVAFSSVSVNVIAAATPTATPTATPPATAGICDDFNRPGPDLGEDWEVKNPDFEIQQNRLAEVSGLTFHAAQVLWSGTTNTLSQYGRFQITSLADNSQGLIFRSPSTNGTVGPHYEVRVAGSEVKWEYLEDTSFVNRPDSCMIPSPVQDGDWFGAMITGVGSDTVVEVFVSAAELGPDPNTWPPPACSLTGDPATPVDTGNRVGVRSYTSSQVGDTFMDDVCVGDSPAATSTPTAAPTATPTATPTPEPGLLMQLASGLLCLVVLGKRHRRAIR